MSLRPDEEAEQSEIERDQKLRGYRDKGLSLAGNIGSTAVAGGIAVAGGKLASRILPLLNEYVPTELALKGINKISPKLGSFLRKGLDSGLDARDGLNFIKDHLSKGAEQPEQAQAAQQPSQGNIIAQYDDELNAFMENEIAKGRAPLEAGAIARTKDKFRKSIEKMEKDHKSNWSRIIESTFGEGEKPRKEKEQRGSQEKSNNSDEALLAALDKIMKM